MKKILIALIALVALVAFVSCDGNKAVESKGLAQVTMNVESKALVASVNDGISSYQFRATPNFSYGADEDIYGTVDEWRDITVTAGTAALGYYSQGSWTFEVRALSAESAVIAAGTATVYLKAGSDNVVAITVSNSTGGSESAGAVHFIIETSDIGNPLEIDVVAQQVISANELGEVIDYNVDWTVYDYEDMHNEENNALFCLDPEDPTTWTVGNYPEWYRNGVNFPAGRLLYVGTLSNVPSASYIYTVRVINTVTEALVSGQMIAVKVIDDTTTNVTGTMISGDFVAGSLTITAPGTIAGTINGETVVATQREVPIELTWTGEEDALEPASYSWMVDGTLTEVTTATFNYTPTTYGKHTVSVIAFGAEGGQIGSASIKVNCLPTAGTQNNN